MQEKLPSTVGQNETCGIFSAFHESIVLSGHIYEYINEGFVLVGLWVIGFKNGLAVFWTVLCNALHLIGNGFQNGLCPTWAGNS